MTPGNLPPDQLTRIIDQPATSASMSAPATQRSAGPIPIPLSIASGVMMAFIVAPLMALAVRALMGGSAVAVLSSGVMSAMLLSLSSTAVATLLILLLGTPLAYVFAHYRFPFKRILTVLIEIPIVMPPVVSGLALLMTFGRRGLLGAPLAALGITLPFTTAAVVIAQLFVAAPFYIRAAQARFQSIPAEIEEAASIDGADGWRLFTDVVLPLSWRSMLMGLILSWARALGEFGATILFAGNLAGRTRTMPLLVYGALEQDLDAALWTGLLLIVFAAVALASVRWLGHTLGGRDEIDVLAER